MSTDLSPEFTGNPPGLLQDDSRPLSRWLASKPGAWGLARAAAARAASAAQAPAGAPGATTPATGAPAPALAPAGPLAGAAGVGHCRGCGVELDQYLTPSTRNCGGDCLHCKAMALDSDAVAEMRRLEGPELWPEDE